MAEIFNLPTKEQFDTMNANLSNIANPASSNVNYINTTSGLLATNVQSAIDEIDEQVNTNKTDILTLQTQNGSEVLTTTAQTLSGAINEIKEQNNTLAADLKKYAKFKISANQSIPNGTNTQIVWGTKTSYNGEDFCEIDATTGQVKILKTGMYQIDFNVTFADNATGLRNLWTESLMSCYPNTASSPCYISMSYFIYVTAGALLNMRVYQTSGGALDVLTSTSCKIRKVA